MDKQLMLSVGMLTYNHEKYIAQAIDSILMQEVNFDYEIVIADDCSTDNTREIILDYQKRYPDIIKPLFQEKNLGSQKNANALRTACSGKYRATLEGDDYWISPSKLQKQVDFLENNPDYVAIGGDFICIDSYGRPCVFPWGDIKYTYCQGDEYTIEDLNNWLLPAHASCMCFRNIFADFTKEELDYFHSLNILGDRRTSLYLLMHGRIKHQKEILMVRRVLNNSPTSMTALTRKTNWHARNYMWMVEAERCVKERFKKEIDLSAHKELRWMSALKVFWENPTISNYKLLRYIYVNSNDKKRYRELIIKNFKLYLDKSIDRYGRAKTIRKMIRKMFSGIKAIFLRTRAVKKAENDLYKKSLNGFV
jgi:glycosyltransferase involved in cell wall biosynthesis